MIDLSAARLAAAAGGRLAAGEPERAGPERVLIDSREAGPGDLFVALPGAVADGGEFAPAALDAGAWGVMVAAAHESAALTAAEASVGHSACSGAAVIVVEEPLRALHSLAREWRRELGAHVFGVTGSTGKTSTKDILAALLRPRLRTHASRENWNTEIGLPLTILEAGRGTQALVLEMAMRGEGQIAELAAVAEPDVGVIVNVGPVHLELLGTVERVAAAKAELIRDLRPGAACVVPASEPLLETHLRAGELDTWTFGPAGDVQLLSFDAGRAEIEARMQTIELDLSYSEPYNLLNTLAAVAAARALGLAVGGRVDVRFSSLRGELVELPGGVTVVNDCYNANPMSMRAALEHLEASAAERRIAVLGTMAELGPDSHRYHREIGARAEELGIDVLVAVGELALPYAEGFGGELHPVATPEEASALLEELARPGDRVLIKGSRSVGLERVLAWSPMLGEVLIGGMASLLICMFLGPRFIEFLRLKEFGQHIREEGPAGHHGKAGTPTMGGLVIFLAVCVPFLIISEYRAASLCVLATALVMGGLGFADDMAKLRKRRSLGVSGKTKLMVQGVTAIALWLAVTEYVGINDVLKLRVIDATVELGYAYPVLIFLVLAGATNGVNLTDGLDGLAAGCCAIVFLAFTAITFITRGDVQLDLALLCACLVGACVGFLWFNSFPASVFMGDTGSLGLGGAIAGLAVITQNEVLLILIGGIFVIEALSVAIQVIAFQRFRTRVFLMAPIHHHFELMGWSETKIILRFWIVAAICAAIGFTLYQQSISP